MFDRLRKNANSIPYDMFDGEFADAEARRARRLESIYHVGQERIWDGRKVLAELLEKHGKPTLALEKREALARVFSVIMWGELGAWKISSQLATELVPLQAKLAAASQVHDEARHFYVMHDYLEVLGHRPKKMDFWARRLVDMTLATPSLSKKLFGMQLMIEVVALTIFQSVRELEVEPVLTELLSYYERDEARHVGLGVQALPPMLGKMNLAQRLDFERFALVLNICQLASLKSREADMKVLGIEPRRLLSSGLQRHRQVQKQIAAEYPRWPEDNAGLRLFDALAEMFFPADGSKGEFARRAVHAVGIFRGERVGLINKDLAAA